MQAIFKKRLAEAKAAVPDPPQQKVKLKMSTAKSPEPGPPKIMLRVGGQKAVTAQITGTPGVTVDSEALARQKHLVDAGANGHATSAGNGVVSRQGSAPAPQDKTDSGSTKSPTPMFNGVKSEAQPGQSPALGTVQLRRPSNDTNEAAQSPQIMASTMPPPSSVTPRLPSGSPHPQAQNHGTHTTSSAATNAFDSKWRQPGKGWVLHLELYYDGANRPRCI